MTEIDGSELLRVAGWSTGRAVDVAEVMARLRVAGYEVLPGTERHVGNLDGLILEFSRSGRPDSIWFDACRALDLTYKAWVDEYSRRVESPLIPIGYSNHDHLLLLVSEAGQVYGGYGDEFGLLGHDIPTAVDSIANNRGFAGPKWKGNL